MRIFDDLPAFPVANGTCGNDHPEMLVVFVGQTECRLLCWLKKGFRHCFAALRVENRWIICDSLKNQIEFSLFDLPYDFDLGEFYRERGHTVVTGTGATSRTANSICPEPLTCVTIVKRIIGVRSFWIVTPWQLFRLLTSMKDNWRVID